MTFRPDLLEWKQIERRQVRERIDTAFHIMEKEYGVTRLLDPEGKILKHYDKTFLINLICQTFVYQNFNLKHVSV